MKRIYPFCFALFLIFPLTSWGRFFDTLHNHASLFNQWSQMDLLEATLTTDFVQLNENRRTEDYVSGSFDYLSPSGERISRDVKVRLRGKYRRLHCASPPLKLKFSKSDLQQEGLLPFNKFKLVTPCIEDPEKGEELVLREMLAYKIYNQLTEKSFKTQLVRLTYIDQNGAVEPQILYGFIIEPTDEIMYRLQVQECECYNIDSTLMNEDQYQLQSLFQQMIGNQDWDWDALRNIKLVQPSEGDGMYLIPYDFDFSELVNADYAVAKEIPLDRDQLSKATLSGKLSKIVLDRIIHKKEAIFKVIEDFPLLERTFKREIEGRIKSFFKILEAENKDGLKNL